MSIRITGTIPLNQLDRLEAFVRDVREQGVDITVSSSKIGWLCPLCTYISFNPNDAENEYCGCCGNSELPKLCRHRQAVAI